MSVLRKALGVSLFVLLSAVLFALSLKPVLYGLAYCYGHLSFSPPGDLFLLIVEIIALGISTTLAAGAFLLVGLIMKRLKQTIRDGR